MLDSATLAGALNRMDDKGWIIKEMNREDRRVLRIYLSDRVKTLKPAILEERERANEEILHGFSLEENFF